MTKSAIERAIDICGMYAIAKKFNLTVPAIIGWRTRKRLPRTEWTGETNYAEGLEELTKGKVTKEMLLTDKGIKK